MRELLQGRYQFPEANVCLLANEAATRQNLFTVWERQFSKVTAGDTVVVYFAGHGSRVEDQDGEQDEADGFDEALLLHDSPTNGVLLDDELASLIRQLHARTPRITLLVDAGHGTAVDTPGEQPWHVRSVADVKAPATPRAAGPDLDANPLPDVVTAWADSDHGTASLERDGQGVFTNALIRALEDRGGSTWSDVVRVIPRWVASQGSYQEPRFTGNLAPACAQRARRGSFVAPGAGQG